MKTELSRQQCFFLVLNILLLIMFIANIFALFPVVLLYGILFCLYYLFSFGQYLLVKREKREDVFNWGIVFSCIKSLIGVGILYLLLSFRFFNVFALIMIVLILLNFFCEYLGYINFYNKNMDTVLNAFPKILGIIDYTAVFINVTMLMIAILINTKIAGFIIFSLIIYLLFSGLCTSILISKNSIVNKIIYFLLCALKFIVPFLIYWYCIAVLG